MIPKFRAWDRKTKSLSEVRLIDYYHSVVWLEVSEDGQIITARRNFDEVVLMQSTGLKDKNGTQIFEGDVVHAYSEDGTSFTGVVTYLGNAYYLKDKEGSYNALWIHAENYEVVGNIYQNLDPLEVPHDPKA